MNAVAALRKLAGVGARIGVDIVGIVAGFLTRPDQSVAAPSGFTCRRARIRIDEITVIASLVIAEDAVAAARGGAKRGTLVAFVEVAVVTGFIALSAVFKVVADDLITTTSQPAFRCTGILINGVGIVALFFIRVAFTHVLARKPISALRRFARGGAAIDVDCIPIITSFNAVENKAVTADSNFAVGWAGVLIIVIAIITGFSTVDDAITAHAGIGWIDLITTETDDENQGESTIHRTIIVGFMGCGLLA